MEGERRGERNGKTARKRWQEETELEDHPNEITGD